MRHTPGPWVVGNQDPLNFGKQRGNGTEPIGFVYGPSFPERSELGREALSNARLIAAAPELLEALKDMGARYGLTEQARAAVARAEGEKT